MTATLSSSSSLELVMMQPEFTWGNCIVDISVGTSSSSRSNSRWRKLVKLARVVLRGMSFIRYLE